MLFWFCVVFVFGSKLLLLRILTNSLLCYQQGANANDGETGGDGNTDNGGGGSGGILSLLTSLLGSSSGGGVRIHYRTLANKKIKPFTNASDWSLANILKWIIHQTCKWFKSVTFVINC